MATSPESDSAFRARAEVGGYWREFCFVRDRNGSQGMSPHEAKWRARAEFPVGVEPAPVDQATYPDPDEADAPVAPPLDRPNALAALIAEIGPLRRATRHQEVDWVFNHLLMPIPNLAADDVPSLGALALLDWVQGHGHKGQAQMNLTTFMTTIYTKTLPARSETANVDRFADDGAALDELEGQVAAASELAEHGDGAQH